MKQEVHAIINKVHSGELSTGAALNQLSRLFDITESDIQTPVVSNEERCNDVNRVLVNVAYPQLEDIRTACQMIANGIDDLTPMLSKEETLQFQRLATMWMSRLRKHKKDVIDGIISELSS